MTNEGDATVVFLRRQLVTLNLTTNASYHHQPILHDSHGLLDSMSNLRRRKKLKKT